MFLSRLHSLHYFILKTALIITFTSSSSSRNKAETGSKIINEEGTSENILITNEQEKILPLQHNHTLTKSQDNSLGHNLLNFNSNNLQNPESEKQNFQHPAHSICVQRFFELSSSYNRLYRYEFRSDSPSQNLDPGYCVYNPSVSSYSDQGIEYQSKNTLIGNNVLHNLSFDKNLLIPQPMSIESQQIRIAIIRILEYPSAGIYPDILILLTQAYFLDDILDPGCLHKYFLVLRNLVEIEKQIISINPRKEREFEQVLHANMENVDLSGSNTFILLYAPTLISLKNFIERKLELYTSYSKNPISIFFGLKLIESVIIKTHKAISMILELHTLNNFSNATSYMNIILKKNSNIIYEIIFQLFSSAFGFNEHFKTIFQLIIDLQKKKCADILSAKKIIFDEFGLSFLPDIFFFLEESEINEIVGLYLKKTNFQSLTGITENHRPIDSINYEIFYLKNKTILKIISYYFMIFEDFEIRLFKDYFLYSKLNNQYLILKRRFEGFKHNLFLDDIRNGNNLRVLLYDTYCFFHYLIVYFYNRDVLPEDYLTKISNIYSIKQN
ncbi:hypothetical protein CWI38_0860p0020 [Hamiltosporidium tvaerminnensis]|uniref:Uncharacterized protein n=1 Tax=Hamiltosporidium tvaerminnensis TaxID=1176355 RepID=A0A4Q9LU65_9MICR|nr:hypothetical protein CWI38_0860p0020 [Hamiltosporidium tvaerminnensis]